MKARLFLTLSATSLLVVTLLTCLPDARAVTVAENTAGTDTDLGSTPFGQSFTTDPGVPVSNIAFNFFTDFPATTPFATGTGFLYNTLYVGGSANLGSGLGFLGQATSNGSFYNFDPNLILQPNTQYFFYENVNPASFLSGGNIIAGGNAFQDLGGSLGFVAVAVSTNFRVTGTPVVPDSGSTALQLGLGFLAIAVLYRGKLAGLRGNPLA